MYAKNKNPFQAGDAKSTLRLGSQILAPGAISILKKVLFASMKMLASSQYGSFGISAQFGGDVLQSWDLASQ